MFQPQITMGAGAPAANAWLRRSCVA